LNGNGTNVFARLRSGATTIVGSNPPAAPSPGQDDAVDGISDDGRYVVFDSWERLVPQDANDLPDVYLRDLRTGALTWVSSTWDGSSGDNWSVQGSISGNGRFVAFASASTNIVAGGGGSGTFAIYVRDLRRGITRRVAESAWTPDLDRDGSTVTYVHLGGANNIYVLDLQTGVSQIADVDAAGHPGERGGSAPVLDADGEIVAFATEDTLDPRDTVPPSPSGTGFGVNVYLRDLRAGRTEQVDVSSAGEHADSVGAGPSISASGRWVAFESVADNLVPNDTNFSNDIFVRDRRRGTTERVSVAADGSQANGSSDGASLTPNARAVAFESFAANLVLGDTNGFTDVFVRRLRR
jgi:Tol biopolymer transport system component